jgi:hypothetical protein
VARLVLPFVACIRIDSGWVPDRLFLQPFSVRSDSQVKDELVVRAPDKLLSQRGVAGETPGLSDNSRVCTHGDDVKTRLSGHLLHDHILVTSISNTDWMIGVHPGVGDAGIMHAKSIAYNYEMRGSSKIDVAD